MHGTSWARALGIVVVTVLSWRYFFIVPIVFAIAIYHVSDRGSVALGETDPKLMDLPAFPAVSASVLSDSDGKECNSEAEP